MEFAQAREALKVLGPDDVWGRTSRRMAESNSEPRPRDPNLGYVMNMLLAEPGIVYRIRIEGFDSRIRGLDINSSPYVVDGQCGWWREGWEAANEFLTTGRNLKIVD